MVLGKPAEACHCKLISIAMQISLLYMDKSSINATLRTYYSEAELFLLA